MLRWVYDDGGREAAGFKGAAGDCVTRAITIASGHDYRDVYDSLHRRAREMGAKDPSPRDGVLRDVYDAYLADLGFVWVPTMRIGSGCTVHLNHEIYEHAYGELVYGPALIARLSGHLACVANGEIRDIYDPSRAGTRCVYGYWRPPTSRLQS